MSSIQSRLHSHILSLRHLSQHFQTYQQKMLSENETLLQCQFCGENFINGSNSMYCCEKCGFYIHASCARPAPLQIQHPRHEHPLDLQQGRARSPDSYYRCAHGCKYELRASLAMRTLQVEKYYFSMPREANDGESRLQFAHEHPLTTFPVRTGLSCQGCGMQISEEEACGCRECKIFLHEACAKAPLEIQHHPFHPEHTLYLSYDLSSEGKCQCHACGFWYEMSPIRYRCEECKLIFHLSCVISTMPRDDDDGEREDISRRPSVIDHPLHPHQLSSYHSKTQTMIKCSICRDRIPSDDFFGCSDCSFFLHRSCAQPTIQHYLHAEHTLTLAQYRDEKGHKCQICESQLRSDSYCYTCQMCDLFIHHTCASVTLSDLEKGVGMSVRYSFHEHELKLYYNYGDDDDFDDDDSGFCPVCGEILWRVVDITGRETLAYKCFSQGCKFKIHRSCLHLLSELPSELEHPCHSLTFCLKTPDEDFACRSCHKKVCNTFAFSCEECDFHLHVACAQKPTLKHPFHEHLLSYFESEMKQCEIEWGKQNNRKCRACHKSCGIDFFSCKKWRCDYTLHYECSLFPPTLNSEHHHSCGPLVLRESFIEDGRAEYCCDICKRRRDPKKWVYYCKTSNCDFVAHVECALSPVQLEVIEEDDFIRREDDIQRREEEIRVAQEQVDAEKERLRLLMEKLKSMREKVELQWMELEERKAEHAKWINMGVIKEDKSIKGEEDKDSTYGKSKKLKAILKKLKNKQACWLIDFLKTECDLPTAFFSRATSQSVDETATSTENDDEGDETATSTENDDEGDETTSTENDDEGDETATSTENDGEGDEITTIATSKENDNEGDETATIASSKKNDDEGDNKNTTY